MMKLYAGYVNNYSRANKTLAKLRETEEFVQLLDQCKGKTHLKT